MTDRRSPYCSYLRTAGGPQPWIGLPRVVDDADDLDGTVTGADDELVLLVDKQVVHTPGVKLAPAELAISWVFRYLTVTSDHHRRLNGLHVFHVMVEVQP